MILIISGLPINFTYHDAKALIKQEAHVSNFILDHLGVDNNGKKKVTVGLVDVAEAPVLINRLNGFIVLDHRLTVAPLGGGGGQSRPAGRNEPQFGQRGPEPQRAPTGQGYSYEPPRGAPTHRTFDLKGPSDASRGFGQRPEPQRPASVYGGAPASQYGGQGRPMSAAPSSAPYGGQKPSSQSYRYDDKHYQPAGARPSPGALLKSPPGRAPDRDSRYTPPRQSPPRNYSPHRSPPRHISMDPKAGKFVDPNFGPNRARPAFGGPQAAPSGNYPGASYIGGPSDTADWNQPALEPYNPLAPSMGRTSVPFAPRNQAQLDRPVQDAYQYRPEQARDDRLPRGRSPIRRRSRSPPRRSPDGSWSRPLRSPPRHRERSPLRRSPPRDRRPAPAPWEGGRQRSPSPKLSRSRWDTSSMQEPLIGPPKVAMSVGLSSRPDGPPIMRDKTSSFVTPAQSNTWADNLPPRDHIPSRFAARSPLRDVGLPLIEGSGPYSQVQNSASRRMDSDPYFDSQNSNFQGVRSRFGEPHEFIARNDAVDFSPQGGPQFGPRDEPQNFRPRDGVQDFDFVPRGGPHDGPRNLEPRGGPRDFGSRDGPRDFGLRDGPRDLGPRDGSSAFGPRELGPGDGPPIFETRGFGRRDEGPRDILGPRGDFGPPDDFRARNGKPRDLPRNVEHDLSRREGPVFEPRLGRDYRDEEPRESFSPRERQAPFDRPGRPPFKEEFRDARGDRPPSGHRSEGRNSDRSHSKSRTAGLPEIEMETRNAVINKISQQMIQNHKPRLHSTDSTLHDNVEHELRKVILERIDSIFGIEFGHDFGSIARGYRQHHKTSGDSALVEKIFAKCTASGYVRKRSPEDITRPSAKKPREITSRAPQSAPRAGASGGDGGSGTIPKYPHGGGDDRGRFKSPFIASFNPIQPDLMDKATVSDKNANKKLYKLYIIKDDLADISVDESMQIKNFFIDEIVKSATKSDFTPSFLLNGVQNSISFEVIAENEKSKKWLENNQLRGFKPFSVLVYTTEELNYERASIFLPGHVEIPLNPMERLRLQNAHLKDLDIGKWKFVKSIITIRGTRVFVDMSKSAAEALTKRDMMLNYQLERVFVFLKSMSTDRCEFDMAFREESISLDKVKGMHFVPIHNLQKIKLHKHTVRISVDGIKIDVALATKLMHLILKKMFEYLQSKEGNSNQTDFDKYFCTHSFLAIYPTNHQSGNWLLSLDLGDFKGRKVLIEKGQYFPKYLRVGIVVPGEIGEYGPSILQNINSYNKIEGVDFTKWKMYAQLTCKDESGSKVVLDIDMQSMVALKTAKNTLKYGDHDLKIPNSYTILINQYEKAMTEMKDQYEVADMEIDGEENNDQITNNDGIDIVDFDAQGFFRELDGNENCDETLVWNTSPTDGACKNKKKIQKGQRIASQTPNKKPTSNDNKVKTTDKIIKNDNAKTKTVQQDTVTEVNRQNNNESRDNAKTSTKNEVTVIDDDIMVYEGNINDVIITIDSDDDDDEVARKKELESIFKCLNREIERRQTKDPLGRDLSLRVLYDSNENDMYQEKYEGKFTKMPSSDLDYFHDRLIKMKPSKKDKRRTAEELESFLVKIRAKIESMSKS